MLETDICIIGAGPAGLMSAVYSAHKGAKTIIVDGNSTAALKLLRTGGGRCNITHIGSADDFIKVYADKGRFLRYALHEFDSAKTMEFFEKNGLQIAPDETGCCYPITNRASDVKRILIEACENFGVKFLFNSKIEHIEKDKTAFILQAPKEVIIAKTVIVATGGISWAQTGSNGDGYKFAKSFGHTIVEPKASLVPLMTNESWIFTLSGVSLERVAIHAEFADKKITTAGPMIFTDNGIGGPAVLDFSRYLTDYFTSKDKTPKPIYIDLVPEKDLKTLDDYIATICQRNPKREIPGILSEFLPRALSLRICEEYEFLRGTNSSHFTKNDRLKLVKLLKQLPLTVKSTRSIREATVTRGGVATEELDDKTMMSKKCPGLFFAGEVIDADGPCGGFNLQICWSTAVIAGLAAGKYVLS